MQKYKTSEGVVDIDMSLYPKLLSRLIIGSMPRAKRPESAMECEENCGGDFNFAIQSMSQYLRS